jgi:magnesium chelatase accessory protein
MSARPEWARDGRDWPHRADSRFVEAGGLRWHVQLAGAGPVLLLLHGTGAATHSWRGLWPLLTSHFTCVAPDLPGHGFTAPLADMRLPSVAAAVRALVETLGLAPAVVAGHSAGAAIGLRMLLDAPGPARLAVAIGGALQPFPGPAAFVFPAMARGLFANPLVPQLFALGAAMPGGVRPFLERATGSAIDAAGEAFYGRLFCSPGHVGSALAMMANWDLVPLERDLCRLEPPLLLLHGARDRAIPPSVARAVAARVPHATVRILDGLGHLPHEEAPALVATAMLDAAAAAGVRPSEEMAR